jgi:hypothetical protein
MADKRFIRRLARNLPDWIQMRLLSLLGITSHYYILQCVDILNTACCVEGTGIQPEQLEYLKWKFIYSYIAESGGLFNQHYFVLQYIDALLPQVSFAGSQQFRHVLSQRLQRNILPSTRDVTQSIIKSLSYDGDDASISKSADSDNDFISDGDQSDDLAVEEEIYIANAGIVLAVPYLPRLFKMLGLTENSAFKDRQSAERGVHMLQFLVNGSVSNPEYQLVLNKLLCGVKTGYPIRREIELSDHEQELLESMLLGMIQHWKSLGNTSISGLRESFLQRNGKLQLKDDVWHLSVEGRSFDMLLDQIPWSYSTIKFPWMDRVIFVEWR